MQFQQTSAKVLCARPRGLASKLKNWLLPTAAINAWESQSHKPVNTQQCGGGGGGEDQRCRRRSLIGWRAG